MVLPWEIEDHHCDLSPRSMGHRTPCEAALHALTKGVGQHQALNCLISAHGISHRIERVSTKANISEPISRFKAPLLGPRWSAIQVPQEALTARCLKVIGDIRFASNTGFENISEISELHRRMQLFLHCKLEYALRREASTSDGTRSILFRTMLKYVKTAAFCYAVSCHGVIVGIF